MAGFSVEDLRDLVSNASNSRQGRYLLHNASLKIAKQLISEMEIKKPLRDRIRSLEGLVAARDKRIAETKTDIGKLIDVCVKVAPSTPNHRLQEE